MKLNAIVNLIGMTLFVIIPNLTVKKKISVEDETLLMVAVFIALVTYDVVCLFL